MSDWDDDEDQGTELVKQLRKQLKDKSAELTELNKELGTLRPQVRKNSISSVLTTLKVNPKIAALVPESVEPTEDAVKTWLADYGDLFGAVKTEDEAATSAAVEPATPIVDTATQQAWNSIQSSAAAAGSTQPDIEQQQLAQLGAAATASGGSFDSFIAALRGDRPIP